MPDSTRTTTIDLIRHGEPQGGRKFRGSQDDPLSATGWQQMRTAIDPVNIDHTVPWQRVITSPLLRCSQFSHELAECTGIPLHTEPGFREVHFGQWEGLNSAEVMAQWPDLLGKVWHDALANTPPDGERLLDFNARVATAWDQMLTHYSGEHLLVVAHGGTIRMIICHTLGLPLHSMWRFDVQYASLSRLRAWHQEGASDNSSDEAIHYSLLSHAAPLQV